MKRNHKCIVTALLSLLIVLSMTGCGQQAVEKNQPQLVKSQKVGVGKDSSEAQYAALCGAVMKAIFPSRPVAVYCREMSSWAVQSMLAIHSWSSTPRIWSRQ